MVNGAEATPERITIPYGVSFEGLMDVLGAWHRAQGYAKPMKTVEVGQHVRSGAKADSKAKVVSNQSSFLVQIGILKKVGQSSQLTELGQEVCRLADSGLHEEFGRAMKNIILDWSLARPILDWVRNRGPVPRQELVEHIVAVSGKSMGTTNAAMGGNALVVLFERVGLMRDEAGSLMMSDTVPLVVEHVSPRTELVVTEPPRAPAVVAPVEEYRKAEAATTQPPQPVEEPAPSEKHEEAEAIPVGPPQQPEESAPAVTYEVTEPIVIEPPRPVEEPAPTEKHEEAEPIVTETPRPVEEAPLSEEHWRQWITQPAVTEASKATEEAPHEEKHEEAETTAAEPAQPAEEEPPAEKHDDSDTA